MIALLSAVLSAIGFAVLSPPAQQSTPDHLGAFNKRYGTTGSKRQPVRQVS